MRCIKGWRKLPSALTKSSQGNCFCLPGLDKSIDLSHCSLGFLGASSQLFCTNISQYWARVIGGYQRSYEKRTFLQQHFLALNYSYPHSLKGRTYLLTLSIPPLVILSLLFLAGCVITPLKDTGWCRHLPSRPFSLSLHPFQWRSCTFFSASIPASIRSQPKHPKATWDGPGNHGQDSCKLQLCNLQAPVQKENVGPLFKKQEKRTICWFCHAMSDGRV